MKRKRVLTIPAFCALESKRWLRSWHSGCLPQASPSLKLAVGSEHDARLSELPLSDLTPQHVFQLTTAALDALSFPKPLLRCRFRQQSSPCRGFLQELAQLFRVGLGYLQWSSQRTLRNSWLNPAHGLSAFQARQQGPLLCGMLQSVPGKNWHFL